MATEVDSISLKTADLFGLTPGISLQRSLKHPSDTGGLLSKLPEALRTEKELLRKLELTLSDLDALIRQIPYAGIKNVGATCYLNTFIQSLYFNLDLRTAIVSLNNVMGPPLVALQNIMGELLLGNMKTVDPIDFVNSLSICRETQEDSNEFSTLFVSWLHKNVVQYSIRSLFEGSLVNSFICPSCGTVTTHSESFMELRLDVSDSSDLSGLLQSISDRFEIIEGYICQSGACKGRVVDVAKQTTFETLPKYLTVVVNRYSFDRSDGRQKVSKPIKIQLDDLEILSGEIYTCFGIIEHVSSSVSSGHYIGHFRDVTDLANWYTFDDAIVKPASKMTSRMHTSNSAYVIHYVNLRIESPFTAIPPINSVLASKISQMNHERLVALEIKKSLKTEIENQFLYRREMIESLRSCEYRNDDGWVVVSADWLKDWGHFQDIIRVYKGEEKFANSLTFCDHGKLSPLSVLRQEVKYVPKDIFPTLNSIGVTQCVCEPCTEEFRNQVHAACAFGESLVEIFEDPNEGDVNDAPNRWVNMNRFRKVFPVSFRKSLLSTDSIIRKFTSCKDSPVPLDLSDGIHCMHGKLRYDADTVLEKRSSRLIDHLIQLSLNCPFFVPRLITPQDISNEACRDCEQQVSLMSTFVEIMKRILVRHDVEFPVTAVPSAWIRRGIRRCAPTLVEFDSLVCEHGKIRQGGTKYSLVTQEELDAIRLTEFAASIPIIKPEICDQCIVVNTRIVNVRIFDAGVGLGEVNDTERGITILHRPSSSRLFGSTSVLSLHEDSSIGSELKLRLLDLGIMGDDEVPEGVEDGMNLYISHPLLRGSLIRLEDDISVHALLTRALQGFHRVPENHALQGSHDTLYVELVGNVNKEDGPRKKTRRLRSDDRDAGLKGSILRGNNFQAIEGPIDLC